MLRAVAPTARDPRHSKQPPFTPAPQTSSGPTPRGLQVAVKSRGRLARALVSARECAKLAALPGDIEDKVVASADAAAAAATLTLRKRKPDPLLEQVRLAMAWNGGVSLAVWMGGVAVEVDAARRAHPDVQPPVAEERTRQVYAAISRAFHRQLVIDILSGASAGGLNGSLLAAAMRKGRRLPVSLLRAKWVGIGDFSRLLQPMSNANPKSVLQGGSSLAERGVFYRELRKFIAAILDAGEGDPDEREACRTPVPIDPVDVVLDVMMTDVAGEPRRFRDAWGFELAAREYRAPLRFRNGADFTLDALAAGARASASFPVAFEPFRVEGDAADRAGFTGIRYAIDGGLLENAPIKPAVEAIPERPANTLVKRYLCYVNAAPPRADPANPTPDEPQLADVIGYVVNVPRDGRFVDQLYALEAEARRSFLAGKLQPDLVRLPLATLRDTATALLRTYRLRRLALSLDEIVGSAARAQNLLDEIVTRDPAARVPWLPDNVDPPGTAEGWRWGIRAAERILHLQLDVLRGPLADPGADPEQRARILEAKIEIEAQLGALIPLRNAYLDVARALERVSPDNLLDELAGLDGAYRTRVFAALDAAWAPFERVLQNRGLADLGRFGEFAAALTSGDEQAGSTPQQRFLQRALSIEVIRRAFSADEAIDSAKRLLFAQLTPLAPTEIFRYGPGDQDLPDSGEDKLTGVRLGHFAGFYRASWRANDFMWGRLDSATRIVDVLVDRDRAEELDRLGQPVQWRSFVDDLLSVGADHVETRDSIVREALGAPTASAEDDLAASLTTAIQQDMTRGDGTLTRTICSRLAQLEILAEELPVLVDLTADDEKLGCFTSPLDIKPRSDLTRAITTLREKFASGSEGQLPSLLGRDSGDEAVSDLALRTVAQTLIVALATMRSLNVVLGKLVAVFRVPFLPLTGIASRKLWERVGVVGWFAGASTYVALRLTTATESNAPLGALWSPPVLLLWISALTVVGVIVVPGVRIAKTDIRRRWFTQGAAAFTLVVTTLGLPVLLAAWRGGLGVTGLLTTGGAEHVPTWLTWLALSAAVTGVPALRLNPLAGKKLIISLAQKLRLPVLLGAIGAVLAGYASWQLGSSIDRLWSWEFFAALSAWLSVPLFALYLVFGSRR